MLLLIIMINMHVVDMKLATGHCWSMHREESFIWNGLLTWLLLYYLPYWDNILMTNNLEMLTDLLVT